ncbi:acyl carrier protein [Streptomyces sp. NPDC015127]|uniref:acyl carrier protein n=1 Tax=Streptomyces sp. NPDC015127 TaxID=3364939 RepID=UPI0036FBE443
MTQTQSIPPRTADELRPLIRAVWERTLGHAEFTDDDPFMSVHGGHSLTAVQVMVELSQELGTRLPVRLIMRHRTVTALAAAVSEQGAA